MQDKPLAYQNARYIKDVETLEVFCTALQETHEWIAIDTEFLRVDTYYPQLSLIQVADSKLNLAIIDPLAIATDCLQTTTAAANGSQLNHHLGLSALIDVLINPNICKVFHSARQDLEVLFLIAGILPKNIFDTQIAAIFFNQGDLAGFARVIESQLGITLAKSQTRTNWHARPLTQSQIAYALDDVYYLAKLYQSYQKALSPQQKQAIFEDCESLLSPDLYQTDPEQAWQKIKGGKNLKPKQLAIVKALAKWREQVAIKNNQPKKWTLSDECLLQIAKRPPKTAQALYKVPNIKSSSVKAFGETWIGLIDEVFKAPVASYPNPLSKDKPASPQEEILLQLLLAIAHQIALDSKITPTNLVQKSQLLSFIREHHIEFSGKPDKTLAAMNRGWRKYLFFDLASQFLNNELSLSCVENTLKLRPLQPIE